MSAMGSIRKHCQTGLLFFDFRFQGKRCREYTALKDSTTNRKQLQKLLDRIDAEIVEGSFEYRRYFRNSKNASKFDVASVSMPTPAIIEARTDPPTPLFSDFAEVWYQEKEVEWRRSHKATIRNELDRSLIPEFGDREVGQISKADVLAFRAKLGKVTARGKQTQLSTARINKMMNPLRQILNEAADRFDFRTPFDHIKQLKVTPPALHASVAWPRHPVRTADRS
jgi:integrase